MAVEISWCWALLSSWNLSPGAAWFLFNAIVGVAAVLSWGAHQGGDGTAVARRRRLTRSASSMVMERLRSMSTGVFPAFHVQEYNPFQEEAEEEVKKTMEPAVGAVGGINCRTRRTMAPPPVFEAAQGRALASTSGSEQQAEAEETPRMEMSVSLDEACAVASSRRRDDEDAAVATVERPRKSEPEEFPFVCAERCRRAYGEVEEKAEVNHFVS